MLLFNVFILIKFYSVSPSNETSNLNASVSSLFHYQYMANHEYLTCSGNIRIANNSKLLLQLERVNLSAAQTLRAAFIKVRSNLYWRMIVLKVNHI